jgi:hypothetical protein
MILTKHKPGNIAENFQTGIVKKMFEKICVVK